MPSLILTGHPCSGKTTFAKVLAERALAHKSSLIQSVVIINESTARPDKTQRECYANSTEEKLTRGALKTEFDKYVKDPTKLVILDSMNYIKGFRYELHCISKSAGQRHGVIWILNREDVAKAWNHERSLTSPSSLFYTLEMMNELMARYEPPDERNRWDKPLYHVDIHSTLQDCDFEKYGLSHSIPKGIGDKVGGDGDGDGDGDTTAAEQVLTRSVYNMHSLSDVLVGSSSSLHSDTNAVPTEYNKQTKVGSSFKRFSIKDKTKQTLQVSEKQGSIMDKDTFNDDTKDAHAVASCNDPKPSKVVTSASTAHTKRRERNVKKIEDLIDGILDSFLLNVEPLKAGISTTIQRSAESNLLHDVDVISQKAMEAFLTAQKSITSGGGGKIMVPLGSSSNSGGSGGTGQKTRVMELKRVVQFSEIKRLRRQYVKWSTRNPPKDTTEEGICNAFLSYVENQL